jgi:hypothetical protein
MSESRAKVRSKSRRADRSVQRALANAASAGHEPAPAARSRLGGFYSAGPVMGLGGSVQRQVAIGKADDPHERQAAAVAERVTSGKKIEPGDISTVEPGAIPQTLPIQKAEAKPEEKKPEPKPVQKAEAKPEQKIEDKKPIQKAETKPEEKKPEPKPVQKAEAKPEQKIEDKKPIRKAEAKAEEKKPEPMPVQKAEAKPEDTPAEPEPVEPIERNAVDKEEPVQVQPAAGGGGATSPSMATAAQQAIAGKGAGASLNPVTRGALESSLGADFGHVRIHDDSSARQAARDINAQAFTHGSDIWLGPGASQDDLRLMAHEATHVVQQSGGIQKMVQRAGPAASPVSEGGWDFEDKTKGKVKKGKKLVIPKMKVPTFKKALTQTPFDLRKTNEIRSDKQREVWDKDIKAGKGIEDKLDKKVKAEHSPSMTKGGEPVYFMKLKGRELYIIGNKAKIKERLLRPTWDRNGKFTLFQVDHRQEWQLGGEDDIKNLWLLESEANMSSGRNIRTEKNRRIQSLLNASKRIWAKPPDIDAVRRSYTITVESVQGGLAVDGRPDANWTREEIRDEAKQLDSLKAMTKKEIDQKGLQGNPSRLVIYTNEAGGGVRVVENWKGPSKGVKFGFGKLFQVHEVSYDQASKKGQIHGVAFKNNKVLQEVPASFPIQEMDAVEYGGYVPASAVTKQMQSLLKAKGLSPIDIKQAELTDQGFVARGQILPTLPLFKDLQIDLVIDGDNIYVSKVFTAGDLKFPKPITVTGASLEIFAGTQGIGARGDANFEIEKVGKGELTAKASTGEGIAIGGSFEFDTKLFNPAKVHVQYAEGKFSGGGEIGIPPGKVKGIQSANIKARFDGESIVATGSVKPSIPGVEQADMHMTYSPEAGLVIGGTLELKKDIPGIAGGSVSAEVTKKPGSEEYQVKASGTAKPKIPGVDATLFVTYDDGAFDVMGTAAYAKGMLSGSVTVGATNRPIGGDGKPGGPPTGKADKITLYGGGLVTLKIAPWLQATAGIRLLPNGEVEVAGEISLPKTLEIFPEKKLDKNIFTIGIDIPIIGVAVAGQRIGIFANISGGLDLSAGIGPGQLQELSISVTYNPAHEDQTKVHGGASLHVPAHAGLRLFVRGGLGVGIPIVSAQAGLEIGGGLGLEGALDAGVQVDWTPAKGLKLEAFGEVYVEPKLKFDITGFVLVEADLWVTTIELYNKRWQLAGFEYGSGLRFGVKFPVKYEEGKPFDISLSDVQFQVPEIKPKELLSNLVKKIA